MFILSSAIPSSAQVDSSRREEYNITPITTELREVLQRYVNISSASFCDWTTDGTGIIFTDTYKGSVQAYIVKSPGGERLPVTSFSEDIEIGGDNSGRCYNGFLFLKDKNGDNQYQAYYCDIPTKEYKMVTDGQSPIWGLKCAFSGDQVAYACMKRNNEDFDIYLNSAKDPKQEKMLLQGNGFWRPIAFSYNGNRLLVGNYKSMSEAYFYSVDILTGEKQQVNPSDQKFMYDMNGFYSKDGNGVYYLSNQDGKGKQLSYYSLADKKRTVLTEGIDGKISWFDISYASNQVAVVASRNGQSDLYLLDLVSNTRSKLAIPEGAIEGMKWSPDGSKIAFGLSTSFKPNNVYVYTIATGKVEQWTYSDTKNLDTEKFVKPELIRYTTFDKVNDKPREIEAVFYMPRNSKGPVPVVVELHGGPSDRFTPSFSPITQFLVNELGYAVIQPNIRGSSGYGKEFEDADNGYKRMDAIKDVGKLLDWIAKKPGLDRKKVVISGISYGGYAALMTMSEYNNRLCGGISISGFSNIIKAKESLSEPRKVADRKEMGDETDPEMRKFLQKISPVTRAAKIKKPVFIVHGRNDTSVPVNQALLMISELKKNKTPHWVLIFNDEGHIPEKEDNVTYYYESLTMFLEYAFGKK